MDVNLLVYPSLHHPAGCVCYLLYCVVCTLWFEEDWLKTKLTGKRDIDLLKQHAKKNCGKLQIETFDGM